MEYPDYWYVSRIVRHLFIPKWIALHIHEWIDLPVRGIEGNETLPCWHYPRFFYRIYCFHYFSSFFSVYLRPTGEWLCFQFCFVQFVSGHIVCWLHGSNMSACITHFTLSNWAECVWKHCAFYLRTKSVENIYRFTINFNGPTLNRRLCTVCIVRVLECR